MYWYFQWEGNVQNSKVTLYFQNSKSTNYFLQTEEWTPFMCLLRLLFWLNKDWQRLHGNGFSPVWVRICLLISEAHIIIFEQYGHADFPPFNLIGTFCKYQIKTTKKLVEQLR